MGKPRHNRLELALCFALVALTLAVYWQTLGFDLTNYDDNIYITDNPYIRQGITPSTIRWALTTTYGCTWQPLVWLSLMLDHAIAGLDPMQFHLTNVILHVLGTLLLFVLLTRMTGSVWPSAFVAGAFAVHPMHVESVAWATERKDVLSTMLFFATCMAYWQYTRRPGVGRYVLVAIAYLLGLTAKPMLVSLPFVLLLFDYWPLGRLRVAGDKPQGQHPTPHTRHLILEKLPLLALAAGACVITVIAQRTFNPVGITKIWPPGVRIADGLVGYVWYVVKTVWPSGMAAFQPHPGNSLPTWMPIGSAVLLAGVSVFAFAVARRRPYITVGWLFYVITLLPVAGFVPVGNHWVAARFSYVPMIGVLIAVAWAVNDLVAQSAIRKALAGAVACIALLGLAAWAHTEAGYWRNSVILFTRAVSVTRDNAIAHYNLAQVLKMSGDNEGAWRHIREAVRLAPDNPGFNNSYGSDLMERGRMNEAIACFKKAIRAQPRSSEGYSNLGVAYAQMGKLPQAIRTFKKALTLRPNDDLATENLAAAEEMLRGAPEP